MVAPACGCPEKVFPVDQNDVRISVIVVVDEGAARAHRFRKPLLPERTVVVGEMNAGLSGDVAEMNLSLGASQPGRKPSTTETRRHGEKQINLRIYRRVSVSLSCLWRSKRTFIWMLLLRAVPGFARPDGRGRPSPHALW